MPVRGRVASRLHPCISLPSWPLRLITSSSQPFGRLLLVFEAHGIPMAGGINEGLVDAAVVTYCMAQGPRCFLGACVRHRCPEVTWTSGLQSHVFSHTFNLVHLGQ